MLVEKIVAPSLGVNDDSGVIVAWHVASGDYIKKSSVVCSFETSKSVVDVEATQAGVITLVAEVGQRVNTGDVVAFLADKELDHEALADLQIDAAKGPGNITQPAMQLIKQHNLSADNFSRLYPLVRERQVEHYLASQFRLLKQQSPKKIAIYGCGQGGRTLYETIKANAKSEVVAFIDDSSSAESPVEGIPVVSDTMLAELEVEAVCSIINDIDFRKKLVNRITENGFLAFPVISADAKVHESVHVGALSFIKAGALIDVNTYIGEACIVDNGCIVAHDNILMKAVRLAPGVSMGSNIVIEEGSIIGVGASINTGVRIGKYCIVAAGSSVTADVPDYAVVDGVPGRIVGTRKQPGSD